MSNSEHEDLREAGQDAALERAWRDESTEQPSARVDAAILSAAHQAAAERNRVPAAAPARVPPLQRWSRWAPMAAAAAVAGLALMLVQTLPRDPERAPAPAAPSLDLAPPAAMPADNSAIAAASQVPSVGSNESRGDAAAERGKAAASTASGELASPEEWVARILSLHDAGDIAAAADVLRAFRATEPNADRYLPAQFREWAGSVR